MEMTTGDGDRLNDGRLWQATGLNRPREAGLKDLVARLVHRPDPAELATLFNAARRARRSRFGDRVFLYGFVYFSTHCRNECAFCNYRASNTSLLRQRLDLNGVLATARALAGAGVHLIDLTMGEDPLLFQNNGRKMNHLTDMVRRVKAETGLPVMVSPGVVDDRVLAGLAGSGADWYACYQETFNRQRFRELRLGQSFDRRLAAKAEARAQGLLTEEGLLCGLGESPDDLADALRAMDRLEADQVRVMTFVPQAGTPLQDLPPAGYLRELVMIALMRLAFPDRLIPASLDVAGLAGLEERLNAGANVVTSVVPPGGGLKGVANSDLDIRAGGRMPRAIDPVLERCELAPAGPESYQAWLALRRGGTAEAATA